MWNTLIVILFNQKLLDAYCTQDTNLGTMGTQEILQISYFCTYKVGGHTAKVGTVQLYDTVEYVKWDKTGRKEGRG